jgi:type IV pilus assembly protein PilA
MIGCDLREVLVFLMIKKSNNSFLLCRATAPGVHLPIRETGRSGSLSRSIAAKGMRKNRGFSIIELLIVVAIILVIAAIAIPNLLQSRMAANESSAAASLRAIASAEITYYNAYPAIGYANTLTDLGGASPCTPAPGTACLLDTSLSKAIPGSAGKSGYQFQSTGLATSGVNTNYVAGATPVTVGFSGNKNFCSTSEQILRMQSNGGGLPPNTLAACYAYPISP